MFAIRFTRQSSLYRADGWHFAVYGLGLAVVIAIRFRLHRALLGGEKTGKASK